MVISVQKIFQFYMGEVEIFSNSANASELFSQPDIDGGLIGGASLKADSFISIIKSF